jgi:D-alanyl-D-alanine dipeptidase
MMTYAEKAPGAWDMPGVPSHISHNVLYLPIAHETIRAVPLKKVDEPLVDMLTKNNPRLQPLSRVDPHFQNTYEGYSQVREGVYKRLLIMLSLLPKDIGIAYFEGFRPLWKQEEYFTKKLKEILVDIKDKNRAYEETTKHVSPFIDNHPTHATGAAVDITLFRLTKEGATELLDMGMFDTIHGPNPQQETFSQNTTRAQRKNRLLLLEAAIAAGLVNYGFEWWHYSYGDRVWGHVKKQPALYGLAVNEDDPILSMDKETYLQGISHP